ncbi:hypothetical protein HKBW3S43_01312 [Candidatus Hakubella thermalkaliphila]|uniref:Uncharacterized protein n=2 Tax=Candidatus Hakubella thermalkaliphila TaxID=2754717 RepID=A0A6V8QH39_9ACTN|nr:hypothetical protein [Actinomycetota bacterium]GFP21775.1 hypothetical protein HKBW3S06_01002 [Candidatus Hakubella thermalkaliphila]GFP28179.1 hypothetical protein HKBW3S33_01596 [Candidatus Hakubella thermalkaliphila]GFP35521.1 hypothetical protein HKBW3S43_01312 [Candidatus Hakubella thermalkaliphila]GFP44079.1 hypothetical protein HKBW3C_03211 [Candidatus Hakubella thermalkaliphila]
MYRQYISEIGLSLEQDTPSTPQDGKYYLILKGKILGSYNSQKRATEAYKKIREKLGYKVLKTQTKAERKELIQVEDMDRFFERYNRYWGSSQSFRKGGKLVNR